MTAISPKVEARHLRLLAVVYVRQSTPQQLQNNQESTRRQYDLALRARQMGWPETAVRVIDDDLGMSGASSQNRAGFQRLVTSIGMGEVGIVLVTEVSRLSRLNSDWHKVIELCAVFRCSATARMAGRVASPKNAPETPGVVAAKCTLVS